MSASSPSSGPCACGNVVFDLSDRKTGEILSCSWCGKNYRYIGGALMAPLGDDESKPVIKPAAPVKPDISSDNIRATRAKIRPATSGRASARTSARTSVSGTTVPASNRSKKAEGPPGGVLPMIGSIVACNALMFLAIFILLPKGPEGMRHLLWDPEFTFDAKALWPDLCALGFGHLFGFACWAIYVYRVHKRERQERKA